MALTAADALTLLPLLLLLLWLPLLLLLHTPAIVLAALAPMPTLVNPLQQQIGTLLPALASSSGRAFPTEAKFRVHRLNINPRFEP
jgi:hypothetical protein